MARRGGASGPHFKRRHEFSVLFKRRDVRSPRVGCRDVNLYVEGAHERKRQRSIPL